MLRTVEQQTLTQQPSTTYFGSPKWLPKQTSEEKCQQRLLQKLIEMKKQNVLRRCFLLESNEFEVLEFYGDAYLYERVSYFIMTTRRFMDPNLMTKLRCSCIKNANLATVFEQLKLAELLEPSPLALTLKSKADILEAIIGELAEDSSSGAEDLLSALIAYIAYMGDKEYFQEANAGVVSIGEGMTTTPKKTKARRRQRSQHKDSGNNNHNANPRIDQKNHGNLSPPAVSNPQKQPLFILTSPKNSIPNNSVNNTSVLPVPPPVQTVALPVTQPVIQPINHPTVQPVLPTRVHNSEPVQIKCNPITLSFINPMTSTTTVLNSNPNNGRESVSTASRNIFFHKMNDVSTSSESSSSSTSLSSSPMNLFLLPNSPIVNGTKNNPRFISYDGMVKPEKMNENKSI